MYPHRAARPSPSIARSFLARVPAHPLSTVVKYHDAPRFWQEMGLKRSNSPSTATVESTRVGAHPRSSFTIDSEGYFDTRIFSPLLNSGGQQKRQGKYRAQGKYTLQDGGGRALQKGPSTGPFRLKGRAPCCRALQKGPSSGPRPALLPPPSGKRAPQIFKIRHRRRTLRAPRGCLPPYCPPPSGRNSTPNHQNSPSTANVESTKRRLTTVLPPPSGRIRLPNHQNSPSTANVESTKRRLTTVLPPPFRQDSLQHSPATANVESIKGRSTTLLPPLSGGIRSQIIRSHHRRAAACGTFCPVLPPPPVWQDTACSNFAIDGEQLRATRRSTVLPPFG